MKKLAIISTHPIQYNAPLFQLLSLRKNIQLKVFYTWSQAQEGFQDPNFNKKIKWDIPLLDSYEYEFVENTSKNPGTKSFRGIQNPRLIKSIKNYQPDAILIFGWKFQSHLKAMFYFKNKIPVLFRGDSTLLDAQNKIKTLIRQLILIFVYKHIDYALYVGQENKKYFSKHKLKPTQLIFAPHAIDNQRFSEKNDRRKEIANRKRKELGLKETDIVYLFIGKFEAKKAPLDIIKLASKIQNPKIKFLFVGNGELEQEMKSTARENCFFMNFQNQQAMPIIYRMGDCLILPSHGPGETWGLVVNEAMACGLSVIVSNKVGCASDLIAENINGFIFQKGSIDILLKLIKNLDKKKLEILGKNAKKKIKNWNYEKVATEIEQLIKKH